MRTNLWKIAAVVAVAMLAKVSPAAAEYDSYTEMQQRVAELESIVADLQSSTARFASNGTVIGDEGNGNGACGACGSCCGCDCAWVGQDFYNCRKRCCGAIAGFELLFLKGFFTDGGNPNTYDLSSNTGTGGNTYETDFDYQNSPRLWLGWLNTNGTGGRFTFWEIDKAANTQIFEISPTTDTVLLGGLEMRTYDIELLQQAMFRAWTFEMSGGVRVAEHNYEATQVNAVNEVTTTLWRQDLQFTGMGLTAAFNAERALGSSKAFSVYGGLRGSLLYGQGRYTEMFIISPSTVTVSTDAHRDDMISIWQINFGGQYKRCLCGGGYLFVRGGFEVQTWEQVGTINAYGGDHLNGDIGLAGFSGAIGVTR